MRVVNSSRVKLYCAHNRTRLRPKLHSAECAERMTEDVAIMYVWMHDAHQSLFSSLFSTMLKMT